MSKHTQNIEMRRQIEQSDARARQGEHPTTDFHDETAEMLRDHRDKAEDPATRRIFGQQVRIQARRKVEAVALKEDSRRRNGGTIG